MRRRSYKYIFVINCFVIFSVVCAVIFSDKVQMKNDEIPVFISTPLINSETLNTDFCKNAASAVIIDAKSGAVLYEKNAHIKLPMASTTKIMTALCVIEKADPQSVVQVSKKASGTSGSSIYLREGEKVKVIDLLYGLLLESGNDAATALAEGVFGSEENCVKYMNERAHDMGIISTNFENPHGLDSENHYTTAYELSIITKEAMKNSLFRQIVQSKNYVTSTDEPRYFSNHNRLLKKDMGFVGVKTGYTSKAGRCLVSCATRENEEYIAVTLSDKLDWLDHENMMIFAFENFNCFPVVQKDDFVIYSGFDRYEPYNDVFVTAYGNNPFSLKFSITIEKDIGKVEYSADGVPLGSFGITRRDKENLIVKGNDNVTVKVGSVKGNSTL